MADSFRRELLAEAIVKNPGKPVHDIMIELGYSETQANQPGQITKTDNFRELLRSKLPDDLLFNTHEGLIKSNRLDHMTFPLFSENPKEKANKGEDHGQALTDNDIRELLKETGCTVRRIVHGEQARHVYFWSPDNRARKDALDMAYKLKGSYAPEKGIVVDVGLSEYLDMIQSGEQKKLIPEEED